MPQISLIAPVYCMEQYLDQFLNSVKQQTFQDYEVILVDDGSKDKSPEILDRYAEAEQRAKVIHKENGGVCTARNTGLDQATGDYVYIVDSDDWLEPTALEVLWNEVERTGADVVYGRNVAETPSGAVVHKLFPSSFFTRNRSAINEIQCALNNNYRIKSECDEFQWINCLGGPPWRGMFRRSIIEEHGIRYNEKLRQLGEDILFWQNIFEHVNSYAYIDETIYHYRKTNASLSHGYKENLLEIYRKVFEEEEKFLNEKRKGREHVEAFYFRVILYIRQAMQFYFRNDKNPRSEKEAYAEFCNLLRTEPYRSAVRKVHVGKLISKKRRAEILLLRYGQNRLYWNRFK